MEIVRTLLEVGCFIFHRVRTRIYRLLCARNAIYSTHWFIARFEVRRTKEEKSFIFFFFFFLRELSTNVSLIVCAIYVKSPYSLVLRSQNSAIHDVCDRFPRCCTEGNRVFFKPDSVAKKKKQSREQKQKKKKKKVEYKVE